LCPKGKRINVDEDVERMIAQHVVADVGV